MVFWRECAVSSCGRKASPSPTTIVLAPDLVLEVGLCDGCAVIAADIERRRQVVSIGVERAGRSLAEVLEDLELGGVPIPLPVRR
jgi:hypothetical protein